MRGPPQGSRGAPVGGPRGAFPGAPRKIVLKPVSVWDEDAAEWPNSRAGRVVEAGGMSWYVQVAGSGPVALLLHGTGAATHSWSGLLPRLARRLTVVAPDLPGHGFTNEPPRGGYSSASIRSRLEELLEAIGADPALLVGHSAGAAVAVRLARRREAVRGVVGLAPSLALPDGQSPVSGPLRTVASSVPAAAAAALLARTPLLDRTLASTGSRLPPEQLRRYRRLSSTVRHCRAALSMMADWDPEAVQRDLAELRVPALMLAGERDAWIPPEAVRASAGPCSTARVETVPETGHLLHEESPAAIASRVLAFAGEVGLPVDGGGPERGQAEGPVAD